MKRVKAACICQTLHFLLKEDVGHDYAVKMVNEEVDVDCRVELIRFFVEN